MGTAFSAATTSKDKKTFVDPAVMMTSLSAQHFQGLGSKVSVSPCNVATADARKVNSPYIQRNWNWPWILQFASCQHVAADRVRMAALKISSLWKRPSKAEGEFTLGSKTKETLKSSDGQVPNFGPKEFTLGFEFTV